VPEPSVTPSPFAVWAEYIANGAMQRREARQVFHGARTCLSASARLRPEAQKGSASALHASVCEADRCFSRSIEMRERG
jgi:hypothetical protein